MSIKFDIKTKLPTLNEYIDAERINKFQAAAMKKKFTKVCAIYALKISDKIDPNKLYSLIINWNVDNNRSDPDNVYFGVKYILDGLVNARVLDNDGRKNIKSIHHNIKTVKHYNVEVILTPEN